MKYIQDNTPDTVTFWETVLRCMSPVTFKSICFLIAASNLPDDEFSQFRYLMDADQIDEFFNKAERLGYHSNPDCRKFLRDNILMHFSSTKISESQFKRFQQFYVRGIAEYKSMSISEVL